MKRAATFGNPQARTRLECVALAADPEAPDYIRSLEAAEIVTRIPAAKPTGSLLLIRMSEYDQYVPGLTARSRLRISAWSTDEDLAWKRASWFHSKLLAHPGNDDDLVGYSLDDGPRPGLDPDYRLPIAVFTTLCRMRPQII